MVRRTRRFLAEAGDGRVTVFQGDAALGAPAHLVPRGGFDAIVPEERAWEWFVHAFGDEDPTLAARLADAVRNWDRDVRGDGGPGGDPVLTVHPAGTPFHRLPPGDVVEKEHCRLVVQWPGRDALLPTPAERGPAHVVSEEGR
ncbi:hypothetical protein ACH4M4_23065 [Streptomyces sp. NPDC017254]|uniref:hypothetical protein n=1 Tax=unclassified Streptomyces TaxID=2593676 RepID=UPI0037888245